MTLKKLLLTTLLVTVIAFSCETDRTIFEGPYHVRFTGSSLSVKESVSDTVSVEVHLVGPTLDHDVVVSFVAGGDARRGIDYTILADEDEVVIPAGEHRGYIHIELINNANNILRSQDIEFELRSVDDGNLQIGQGESAIGDSFTLTIVDDCILGGTYSGIINLDGGEWYDDIQVTSGGDCERYNVSNWNLGVFPIQFDFPFYFIDNNDNTLTIPRQETDFYGEIFGVGSVDPVTHEIGVTLTFIELDSAQLPLTYIPE